jgi:hypothetical protein
LPWDLDGSASPESDSRFQGERGLSIVPRHPTISNCVHGQTQPVGGTTVPYNGSLLGRSWLPPYTWFLFDLVGAIILIPVWPFRVRGAFYRRSDSSPDGLAASLVVRHIRMVPEACPACGSNRLSPQRGYHSSAPDIEWERPTCDKCGWLGGGTRSRFVVRGPDARAAENAAVA